MRFFRRGGPLNGFIRSAPIWILILALSKVVEEAYGSSLTSSTLILTGSTLFAVACLAVVVLRADDGVTRALAAMKSDLDVTFGKMRLSVAYYPGGTPELASILYQKAKETVGFARQGATILAVNSYVEVRATDRAPSEDRRTYLAEIESKAEIAAQYHRVIQVRPDDLRGKVRLALGEEVNEDYLEHYRWIVKRRHSRTTNGPLALLEAVPATYPTSFVILQNIGEAGGRIIWQMNEHAPTATDVEAEQLTGIFIVDDPDGQLIPTFTKWFHQLVQAESKHAVELRELA